jgi:hypothetical protein
MSGIYHPSRGKSSQRSNRLPPPSLGSLRRADSLRADDPDDELSLVIHGRVEGLLFAAWLQDEGSARGEARKTLEAEASRAMSSVVAEARNHRWIANMPLAPIQVALLDPRKPRGTVKAKSVSV